MTAYEFYWDDERNVSHLIGILPERRRNPRRITRKSIMKWGKKISSDDRVKRIYFIEVKV